jgi:PPOX class probable FMN-dependent enzyme
MISTLEQLRELYPPAQGRSVAKQLDYLDAHCLRFIALSPFVVIASGGSAEFDASPRGGEAGFVKAAGSGTLLLPDSPGNNRLDTLSNIVETGKVGLLFLIPGIDETLRVNGRARLLKDPALLQRHFGDAPRLPKLVIEVQVAEAYLHCAKAFMRSALWSDQSRQPRSVLPSMGQMIGEQTGMAGVPETEEQMRSRYAPDL